MNKLFAIFFLALYTASFSGMLWAKDCSTNGVLNTSSLGFDLPCSTIEGHENESKSHPLLQFCKLVETHKAVIVGKQQKFASPYYTLFKSIYPPVAVMHTCSIKTGIFASKITSNQIYLHNRVLLI